MDTPANSLLGFVNLLLGSGFGALMVSVLYPVVGDIIPPESGEPSTANVTLPWKPSEIRVNTGRIFKFGTQPGILVKTPAGELRAFSATCTHLECIVQYRGDLKQTLVRVPQRALRPARPQRFGSAAAAFGRVRGQRGERRDSRLEDGLIMATGVGTGKIGAAPGTVRSRGSTSASTSRP